MGMDVYGVDPQSEKGSYFRNSVWSWRPLADYCQEVAPEITEKCAHWQSNDADGLDDENALALARALREELESGRTEAYAKAHEQRRVETPDVLCDICGGTGQRQPPPVVGAGDVPCNGCSASGMVRPFWTHYPFTVRNVEEFVDFLEECGGFEIC